jgi:predicted ChrR family anti-sigma factor
VSFPPKPDLVREVLEGTEPAERQELFELIQRLPEALLPAPAPAQLRARLLEETTRAPERYAPLTRAVSELFDLPREQAGELLRRSAEPRVWKFAGLPGIQKLAVGSGPRCRGAQAYLVRFAAGRHFPEHRHDGLEQVLILGGSYTEDAGRTYATGDLHVMQPGTAHAFTIANDEDCIAATLLEGKLNFRSLPLRLLARLLGH